MSVLFFICFMLILSNCTKNSNFIPVHRLTIGYSGNNITVHQKEKIKKTLRNRLELYSINHKIIFKDTIITILLDSNITSNQLKNALIQETKIEFWHTFKNTEIGNSILEIGNKVMSNELYSEYLDSISNNKNSIIKEEQTVYLTDEQVQNSTFKTPSEIEDEISLKSSPFSTYLIPY